MPSRNETCLVVGGSSGLGRSLAERFASAGYALALVSSDRRDIDAGRECAGGCFEGGALVVQRHRREAHGAQQVVDGGERSAGHGPTLEAADRARRRFRRVERRRARSARSMPRR